MFWGLIMEPRRRYSQTVTKPFHISMAALDETTADGSPTQVICSFDDRNYLLCTLEKGRSTQVTLDLNYDVGDEISFATNGNAHVHLTGYLLEDEEFDEGDVEEEDANDEVFEKGSTKRILKDGKASLAKKSRTLELLEQVNSNDEDDSDDSDVNMSDLMDEGEDEEDTLGTSAFDEEEDDDSDEDDEGDGDEEEEVAEEESEGASSLSEEEEAPVKKTVENGVSGKKKKQQKQQQVLVGKKHKDKKQKQNESVAKVDKTPNKTEKTPNKAEKTPNKAEKTPGKGDKTPKSPKEGGSPQKRTVEGGVIIEELKVGNGPIAKPGKFVRVYYEGRFKNNNKMFDSSTKGSGFEFRLGRQEVIKGWDVGLAGMKVGGKRKIICPANMAYGQKGSPPTIPPNSTLVFEVELKNVK